MKINYGTKVKYTYTDSRVPIYNNIGVVVEITKHCIWIDNGKYRESFNLADVIAANGGGSGTNLFFENKEGKFVKGRIINNFRPVMGEIEI